MQSPTLDPTAGERARALHISPEAPPAVTDPTDTRYGAFPFDAPRLAGATDRVFDPTDPACVGRSD